MIDWTEHKVWLREKLEHFHGWKNIAFAAACAGRTLPVYLSYAEHLDPGRRVRTQVDQVALAVEFVWRGLIDIDKDVSGAQSYISMLERIIDEMEDVEGADSLPIIFFDSEALYAAYSINSSLLTYLNRRPLDAARTASYNYDLLGYYFSETGSEQSDVDMEDGGDPAKSQREEFLRFANHPLLQNEINQQRQDVAMLDAANTVAPATFVTSFREASTNISIIPSDILSKF